MGKQEIYTPMEKLLIETLARREERAEALKTKEKAVQVAELDLMLLEMEAQQDMMDGLKGEEYLL